MPPRLRREASDRTLATATNLQNFVEFAIARRALGLSCGALRFGRQVGRLRLAVADRSLRHRQRRRRTFADGRASCRARVRSAYVLRCNTGSEKHQCSNTCCSVQCRKSFHDHDVTSCVAAPAIHPDVPSTRHRQRMEIFATDDADSRSTSGGADLSPSKPIDPARVSALLPQHACSNKTSAPLLHFHSAKVTMPSQTLRIVVASRWGKSATSKPQNEDVP
jgi:hypothetical protein